jgi:hypothetical protein
MALANSTGSGERLVILITFYTMVILIDDRLYVKGARSIK